MKFVSFQSLQLLAALVFFSFNKEAFASKGLRNNNDDAVKDDDSRKLFFGALLDDVLGGDFEETFLPSQLDFLQEQFSLVNIGKRPEYCHVKSFGSCKVDESDVCEISTTGACSIGNFASCQVAVLATCDTEAETCRLENDVASSCLATVGSNRAITIGQEGFYKFDQDVTATFNDATFEGEFNSNVDIQPDDPPVRRGLLPSPPEPPESCFARAEGETSCEFRNGKCHLNVDKVCVLWVDVEDDHDQY